MAAFINRKIYEHYYKTEDDEDEIGETYSPIIGSEIEAKGLGKTKEEDKALMVPNETNLSYIKNGFSSLKNILVILSILCCIVYRNDSSYENVCKSWGFPEDSVKTLNGQLVFGNFFIDGKLVITFKGSSSKADFMTDLDLISIDDNFDIPGKMHRGFYKLLFETGNYIKIINVISSYPRITDIILTGHSLGGGLATLMYAYLKKQCRLNIWLYTFGCPRSGDSDFAKYITSKRVVNANDVICTVPFAISYRHPDSEFVLGTRNFFRLSRNDHHLVEYYKNILKIQSN